jgi:uncharacterized protein (TIGR03435 family)
MSRICCGVILSYTLAWAQVSTFEVASFKPASAGARGMHIAGGPGTSDPGTFTCGNCSLSILIMMAYDLRPFQLRAAGWMDTTRYDVVAKVPSGTSIAAFQLMQRALLADRLRLRAHRENQPVNIYELTIAKNGPKMVEARGPIPDKPDATWRTPAGGPPVRTQAQVTRRADTTSDLAKLLSDGLGAPVKDSTGLRARYDYTLSFMMEPGGRAAAPMLSAEPDIGVSLIDAVREQLGLALTRTKGATEILVIDGAEKVPSEN